MSTALKAQPSEEQLQRLQFLVSRIAARTLSEWDTPFRRPALEHALPDLAIANPLLHKAVEGREKEAYPLDVSDGSLGSESKIYLLETKMDTKILLRMAGEARSAIAIQALQESFWEIVAEFAWSSMPSFPASISWSDIPDHLTALAHAGVDTNTIAQMGTRALEVGSWLSAPKILKAMAMVGASPELDLTSRSNRALRSAAEGNKWSVIPEILIVSANAGVDLDTLKRTGTRALQQALEWSKWNSVPDILKAMTEVGITPDLDLGFWGTRSLKLTLEAGMYWSTLDVLEALAQSGVVPDWDLVRDSVSTTDLQVAVEGRRWSDAAVILDVLSNSGVPPALDLVRLGTAAVKDARQMQERRWVPNILRVLSHAGLDLSLLDIQDIHATIERGYWCDAPGILKSLIDAGGFSISKLAGLGEQAILDVMEKNKCRDLPNVLASLARSGVPINLDLVGPGELAILDAIEWNRWEDLPGILTSLACSGVPVNLDLVGLGEQAILDAIKKERKGEWEILEFLSYIGAERIWLGSALNECKSESLGQIQVNLEEAWTDLDIFANILITDKSIVVARFGLKGMPQMKVRQLQAMLEGMSEDDIVMLSKMISNRSELD